MPRRGRAGSTSTLMRNQRQLRPRLTRDVAGAIEAVRREMRDAQDAMDLANARREDARRFETEAKQVGHTTLDTLAKNPRTTALRRD